MKLSVEEEKERPYKRARERERAEKRREMRARERGEQKEKINEAGTSRILENRSRKVRLDQRPYSTARNVAHAHKCMCGAPFFVLQSSRGTSFVGSIFLVALSPAPARLRLTLWLKLLCNLQAPRGTHLHYITLHLMINEHDAMKIYNILVISFCLDRQPQKQDFAEKNLLKAFPRLLSSFPLSSAVKKAKIWTYSRTRGKLAAS